MKPWIFIAFTASFMACQRSQNVSRLHDTKRTTVLKVLKGEKDRYFNIYGNQAIELLHCGVFNENRAVLNLPAKNLIEFSDYLSEEEFASLSLVPDLNLDCQQKSWKLSHAYRGSENITMRVIREDGKIVLAQLPLVCSGILNLTGWETLDDLGEVDYREPRESELVADLRVDLSCGSGQTGPTPTDPPSAIDNDGWELASTFQAIDNDGTGASLIELKKGSFVLGVAAIDGVTVDQFLLPFGSDISTESVDAARNLATAFNLQQDLNNADLLSYREVVPDLVGSADKVGMPVLDLCWSKCGEGFQPKHFYYKQSAEGSLSVIPVTQLTARRTRSTHPENFGRPQIEWTFRDEPRATIILDPGQDKLIRALGLKVIDNTSLNFDDSWNLYTRVEVLNPSLELPFKAEAKSEECRAKFDTIVNRYVFEDVLVAQCGRDFKRLFVEAKADAIEFNGTLIFDRSKFTSLNKVVFSGGTQPMLLTFKPTGCASCEQVRPGLQVADGVLLEMRRVKYGLDASGIQEASTQFLGIDVKASTALLDQVQLVSAGRIFDIGLQSRSSTSTDALLLLKSIEITAKLGISSNGQLFMRKASSVAYNSFRGVSSYGLVLSGNGQSYLSDLSIHTAGQAVRVMGSAQVLLHNAGLHLQSDTAPANQAGISMQTGKVMLYKSEVTGFRFAVRKEPTGDRGELTSIRSKFCVSIFKTDQNDRIFLSPGEISVSSANECSSSFPITP